VLRVSPIFFITVESAGVSPLGAARAISTGASSSGSSVKLERSPMPWTISAACAQVRAHLLGFGGVHVMVFMNRRGSCRPIGLNARSRS